MLPACWGWSIAVSERIRSFIAVDLSGEARAELAATVESLNRRGLSGVRWVRDEGMHLTLKFLGEIDSAMVPKVIDGLNTACRETKPFTLSLDSVGAFPNLQRPRVLWVGLAGDLETLGGLQRNVESRMERLGFPAERRRFNPHVTLGRVRDNVRSPDRTRIGEAVAEASIGKVPSWEVRSVRLMRSTLAPSGAVYTCLAETDLGSA